MLMSCDSIRVQLIGKQDTAAVDEYPAEKHPAALQTNTLFPVQLVHGQQLPLETRSRKRFGGSKRKNHSDKGKKCKIPAFLSCDGNAFGGDVPKEDCVILYFSFGRTARHMCCLPGMMACKAKP